MPHRLILATVGLAAALVAIGAAALLTARDMAALDAPSLVWLELIAAVVVAAAAWLAVATRVGRRLDGFLVVRDYVDDPRVQQLATDMHAEFGDVTVDEARDRLVSALALGEVVQLGDVVLTAREARELPRHEVEALARPVPPPLPSPAPAEVIAAANTVDDDAVDWAYRRAGVERRRDAQLQLVEPRVQS